MKQAAWANRRILLTADVNYPDVPDPSGQPRVMTLTAPDGYRVVSGGWNQGDDENPYVVSSLPNLNSDMATNTVDNEAWTFVLTSAVLGHGSHISFFVVCEKDDMETRTVNIPYGL